MDQRDRTEKLPFVGVFTSLCQLGERFEIRKQIIEDVQSKSLEWGGVEVGKNCRLLQLQLKESEHLAEKLSQTVSDLTAVLYVKEAEVQYWQSRVSQYRQEALTLAKSSNTLKATLSELELTMEFQSKELAALHLEQKKLREELAQACREKEELLQRCMEEKRKEADRLNKYNDIQERWQRLAKQLEKHLRREMKKEHVPIFAHPVSPKNETRNRELCTSTGIMLTQVQSSLPQALNTERYPKWKTEQKCREYPFSEHDNKHAFKNDVSVFSHDVGRRKCLDERRQHNSHFCLCDGGGDPTAEEATEYVTAYQSDFQVKPAVNVPSSTRRFPRNHKQKSAEAAFAQTGERFMWFGRHDSGHLETPHMLAAVNLSANSES
ncbi:hypothetical protein Q8A73_001248 [Channa argus]|nr:hypothetical protein Q8A73_001248 [Channa argus]